MGECAITVRTFEYHVRSGVGIVGPWQDRPLWCAVAEMGGHTFHFSRLDGESEWCCDARFGAKGFPYFCHGEGSRCCRKQVATGEMKQALEERKSAWGNRPAVPVFGAAWKEGQV